MFVDNIYGYLVKLVNEICRNMSQNKDDEYEISAYLRMRTEIPKDGNKTKNKFCLLVALEVLLSKKEWLGFLKSKVLELGTKIRLNVVKQWFPIDSVNKAKMDVVLDPEYGDDYLKENCKILRDSYKQIMTTNENLSSEVKRLSQTLKEKLEKIDELTRNHQNLVKRNKELGKGIKKYSKYEDTEGKNKELECKLQESIKWNEAEKNRNEKITTELETLKKDYNGTKEKFECLKSEKERLDIETNDLRKSEKNYKDKLTKVENENKNLRSSVNKEKSSSDKLRQEIEDYENEIQNLNKKVKELSPYLCEKEVQLNSEKAAVENLKNDNCNLEKINYGYELDYKKLLKENGILKSELEKSKKNLKQLDDIKKIQASINLKSHTEKLSNLEKDIVKLRGENKNLKEKVNHLVFESEEKRQGLRDQIYRLTNSLIDSVDTAFKLKSDIIKNKSFIDSNTQNYIYSGWENKEQNHIKCDAKDINVLCSKNYVVKSSLNTNVDDKIGSGIKNEKKTERDEIGNKLQAENNNNDKKPEEGTEECGKKSRV